MSDLVAEWTQRTAALIVDDGHTDWRKAREKAAHTLGLTRAEMRQSPNDEDIIAAIREHLAIFYADEHPQQLQAQRQLAFTWMQRLSQYEPRLTGPVAEGWAHAESRILIELIGIDDKSLSILLLNHGVDAEPVGQHQSTGEWDLINEDWHCRLRALTPGKARPHPERLRLNTNEVQQLIEKSHAT